MNTLALMWLVLVAVLCIVVARRSSRARRAVSWIYYVFFASGCPALIYQIVWERSLFAIYGVNVESVTVVVTGFMLGLGLGSLAGGYLSRTPNMPLLALFGTAELGTALYGAFSLRLFHLVAVYTAAARCLQRRHELCAVTDPHDADGCDAFHCWSSTPCEIATTSAVRWGCFTS